MPDIPYYELTCPTSYSTPPDCGDFQPLGGSVGSPAGDLTSTGGGGNPYGTDRAGSQVSWVARRAADFNTMWATTSAGRVFVTRNANATDPATVVWYRVDNLPTPGGIAAGCPAGNIDPPPAGAVNCSPTRHPNGIYPDPSNPNVAYVAYSGFNGATLGTKGHVYRVTIAPTGQPAFATFTDLNVESGGTNSFPTSTGMGDLPVNDIVMDDVSGRLYAATDFGVVTGTPATGNTFDWTVTTGMPRQEITHLAIVPGQRDACRVCGAKRLMYAATHSQGVWVMYLN